MNLVTLLVAGAMVVAAPAAGYYALGASDALPDALPDLLPRADASSVSSVAMPDAAGRLVFRHHHDGDTMDAKLRILDEGGDVLDERRFALVDGEETIVELSLPVGVYTADFEAKSGFLIFERFRATGQSTTDLAECPSNAVELLSQTYGLADRQGVVVLGAACLPGPARHVGMQTIGAAVVVPFPLCPLECTMGYGFAGNGGLEFEVPEGSSEIRAKARWEPTLVNPQAMTLWLAKRDDSCGEGCWRAVHVEPMQGGEGAIVFAAPEPGLYSLRAHLAGPAGAAAEESIWLMAVVSPP